MLATTWLDLCRYSLLVQPDTIAIALFVWNTFVVEENVLHQEPGCLVNVYIILQQGRMWKYGNKEHFTKYCTLAENNCNGILYNTCESKYHFKKKWKFCFTSARFSQDQFM